LLYRKKFPEKGNQIGLEYCIAGPAFPFLYEFVKTKYPVLLSTIEKEIGEEKFSKQFPSDLVFQKGVEALTTKQGGCGSPKQDLRCAKVVELFVEMYGMAIGDIALRTLSYSGIYLIGGISVTIAPYLQSLGQNFMVRF